MLHKLLQSILSNEKIMSGLRVIGWIFVIVAIVYTNMIMKGEEIAFVYNNF